MKIIDLRVLLSAVCVASVLAGFTKVNAGPVRFDQVVQIVNARPGKAESSMFSRLAMAGSMSAGIDDSDDDKKKPSPQQDGRVITDTDSKIVEDTYNCDCEQPRTWPKWALLGLAAIPVTFILLRDKKDTPTPTPTVTPPITPTPTATPTVTPTPTPTATPPITPTPTPPEPVPEPMTILLFGTGLASIGLAARRRFGKKGERGDGKEEE